MLHNVFRIISLGFQNQTGNMDNLKMATITDSVLNLGYIKALTSVAERIVNFLKGFNIDNLEGKEKYAGVGFAFVGVYVYYWNKHSFWRRRNIKTPTPIPIFGNFLQLALNPRQRLELEWPKRCGRLYGYYVGTQPVLVCADANLLRKICIKDFNVFPNHFFLGVPNRYQKHILIFQKDDHWRGMRAILSPTFSSSKIKIMFKLFNECCNDLVDNLDNWIERDGGKTTIEVKKTLGSFTIDSAVKSFYGIKLTPANTIVNEKNLSTYSNTREGFAFMARRIFDISFVRFLLSNTLPWGVLRFLNFPLVGEEGMKMLADKAEKIIEHRQRSGEINKYQDYLELLLNAQVDSKVELDKNDTFEEHHTLMDNNKTSSNDSFRPSRMKLTEMEVSCQVMMLMMVATETTSSFLGNTLYTLAFHSEIQEKLYRELMKIKNSSETGDFSNSYEQLTSNIYLDCVVSESLRLMPPALFMDRVAEEDYYIEEYNVTIPKGMTVNLAYHAIHRDPEYWPEPDEFNPDRFLPENKSKIVPGSYSPFGIGPRSCVGFRFALTEGKLALARLVTDFRFEQALGTTWPPVPVKTTLLLNDLKNMNVSVRRRD